MYADAGLVDARTHKILSKNQNYMKKSRIKEFLEI
jgi:hypothetical protein